MVDLERRVFVGNLAYRTTSEDLKEHFQQVGKVKKAEVYYDHSGKGPPTVVGRPVSKGCGVVEFVDEEDAREAVKELAETMLDGRAILVREDRDPPPSNRKHDSTPNGGSRPGDWICPKCADMQFASRRECRSCGEPRPVATTKPKNASFGANDWTCPACGDHQFARNVKCRQCGEPKPAGRRQTTHSQSRSRSRGRSRSRRRSSSRRSRGRRCGRHRVNHKEKQRGGSKKKKEKKVESRKSDKKRKIDKKSRKDKGKKKEKKHKRESSVSESYSYYSSYDSNSYSSE